MTVVDHQAVAVVDGGNLLGPIAARAGLDIAMSKARQFGASYVTVHGSNHFSYAGWYCEIAAENGLMALCSSGGEPTVAAWGGREAFFTNSPLALGAPTGGAPIIVDLATSVSSRGNILLASMLGESIPNDWAIDALGRPTTDPNAALKGSVLPMAGAKGYALIVALELLNTALAGGPMAPDIGSQASMGDEPARVSHFFMVIDPQAFMDMALYKARMDTFAERVRRSTPSNPDIPVRLPGDRRREIALERGAKGIPIPAKLLGELRLTAQKYAPNLEDLI